jgi:transglutaminase-like putative cysteine protease
MLDTTRPLVVSLDYEAADYPITGDSHTMLAIPWLSDTLGYANYLLGSTGLDERKYPLYTRLTAGVEESFTVELDPVMARQTEAPEASALESEGLRVDSVEFSTNAYLDVKQLLKDREYEQRKRVMIVDAAASEPEHDIRVLSDDLGVELTSPTQWTSRHKLSKQIVTYAGKKDHSELKLSFNPAWESVELVSARIVNPDGSVHTVVEEEMNVMDAGWVGGAPRYPPERTLVVSLPGVEEGSVITYEVVRKVDGKPFFSLRKTFQGFDPIDAASVSVSTPTNLTLHITDLTGNDDYQVTTAEGVTTHSWQIGSQSAIKPEDNLPPRWSFLPTLVLSTGEWEAYADELAERLTSVITNAPACEQKARELTADCEADIEKVQVIRDFVARNIRSAGPWLTALPLDAITAADTTLADGYGNTTDRALVLAAMLKAVGIDAELLLASSWAPRLDALNKDLCDTPQRGLFSHLLVRVMDGRRPIYLNETDHYAQLGTTPFEGRLALDMSGQLSVIEPARSMAERSRADFLVELEADGDAQLTATRAYYGMAFGATRRMYEEMPPEERRRHFMELIASLSQAAQAHGDLATDFDVYPGFRSFTVDIPRYAVRDGDYLYVTLPAGMGSILRLNTDTRDGAFYRSEPQRTTVRYDVKLPANTKQVHLLPPEIDWQGPDGLGAIHFRQQPTEDPLHLRLMQEVDLEPAVIRPEAYPVLLDLHQQLQHPSVRTILVELEDSG